MSDWPGLSQSDWFRLLDPNKEPTIEERFEEFHQANPHVYERLVRMTFDLRNRGITHWGIKGLWEKLRWDIAMETSQDPYKLNNDYTALYARRIMEFYPSLDGFFRIRKRKGK